MICILSFLSTASSSNPETTIALINGMFVVIGAVIVLIANLIIAHTNKKHLIEVDIREQRLKLYLEIIDAVGWIPTKIPDEFLNKRMSLGYLVGLKDEALSGEIALPLHVLKFIDALASTKQSIETFDRNSRSRFFLYASTEIFNEFNRYLAFLKNSVDLTLENELNNKTNALVNKIRISIGVND